jgi:hypothetical protein
LVVYPDEGLLWSATFWGQKSVVVTYSAGYDADGSDVGTAPQIPLDLDHVLWEAFMYLWSTVDPLTGGPSTDPVGEGDTKSVTVFDAFKIDYAVGATAEGGSETQRLNWDWLAPWEPVLSLYQSGYSGANVGVA